MTEAYKWFQQDSRYRLPEMTRGYALRMLRESGEVEQVSRQREQCHAPPGEAVAGAISSNTGMAVHHLREQLRHAGSNILRLCGVGGSGFAVPAATSGAAR